MRRAISVLLPILLASVALAGEVGWRTDGSGRYPDAEPPVTFTPEKAVWVAKLPAWSNASPVVLADRVIVCAEPATVLAVDKASGEILWRTDTPLAVSPTGPNGKPRIKTHKDCGFASATPTSDGTRVFVLWGTGVVSAYAVADGKHLWSRLVERPVHVWGQCASPLLVGGRLVVHVRTLTALDPETGSVIWRQDAETWPEGIRGKRWGSPVATRIGETDVVVSIAGNVVRATDGAILFPSLGRAECSSPLVADGIVYFLGAAQARAVRLPSSLDGKPETLWDAKLVREAFFASPLLHEGLLYIVSQRGHFSALDAETGTELYREKLLLAKTEKIRDAAYTSPTLGGGAIYFAGMDGSVVVVKPGHEYEQLARNRVEHSLRANPVFEGTRMYLRAPGHLYCFGR